MSIIVKDYITVGMLGMSVFMIYVIAERLIAYSRGERPEHPLCPGAR